MNTALFLVLALLQTGCYLPPQLRQAAVLEYPFTTTGTQWVVLDLELNHRGGVQSVQVLQGASPFLEVVLSSLNQWEFTTATAESPTKSHVTAVFMFRPRDLFSASPLSASQIYTRTSDSAALPVQLSDPGYPANSVGEGMTILEMRVSDSGSTDAVRIIRDEPGLAAHTERVARTWKFQPAKRNGAATTGTVIVVAWYLRPILFNNPQTTNEPYYPYEPIVPPTTFRDGGPKPRGF
jgi:hypothetical protein